MTTTTTPTYISADDHLDLNELPADLWSSRLPPELRDAAPRVVDDPVRGPIWEADGARWGPHGPGRPGSMPGLFERAAENHINMVAVNGGALPGGTFAARLHKDFTILTPWETREFDGKLTFPPMTVAKGDEAVTHAEITPAYAANKVVSVGTDLLSGRAWALASPLVAENTL